MGSINSKQMKESPGKCQIMKSPELSPEIEVLDETIFGSNDDVNHDPRSPHICRTPINEVIKSKNALARTINLTDVWELSPNSNNSPTSGILAQKLLNNLNFNPLDPRSPNLFIDRTPIVFDESTDLPVYVDVDNDASGNKTEDSLICVYEKPFANDNEISCPLDTPKVESNSNKLDPRSPSEGVDRTPLVFEEEITDKEILESVTMKLSKNEIQNKQLERVKNPRSRMQNRSTPSKSIYADEKSSQSCLSVTPKRVLDSSTPKRTPLSCVANKSHLRSKSVENSSKASNKVRVSIYDDSNLKSRQDHCGSGESPLILNARRLNI